MPHHSLTAGNLCTGLRDQPQDWGDRQIICLSRPPRDRPPPDLREHRFDGPSRADRGDDRSRPNRRDFAYARYAKEEEYSGC